MKSAIIHAVVPAFMLMLAACHREPDPTKLADELVVSTSFDPEANFGTYATYAIPTDTIGFVSNDPQDDTIWVNSSTNPLPREIIQGINTNLQARGFSHVSKSANPDIGINVTLVKNFNAFQ